MKILCSNCAQMQDPIINGWVCKHCYKKLSAENMIVYSDDEQLRYFIGFPYNGSNSKIVLVDTWNDAEDALGESKVYLANYNEVFSSIK